jgi:DNA repair protein RadA/Sms
MSYRCDVCGHRSAKWMGFCPQCRSDGALVEEAAPRGGSKRGKASAATPVALVKADRTGASHRPTGIGEVDRVLGGGLVPGSAVLLGGEPGVGKSTLILQLADALAATGAPVLIASAEESVDQVALRAGRLGLSDPGVAVVSDPDVDAVIAAATEVAPFALVVDSIQTVAAAEVSGAPGGVAQVREAVARLIHFAKSSGVAVVLVGHVTKDGSIAGPKLVEHAVDVVLYLEGDAERGLRALRGLKNRFGATHEVGLFEMGETGLSEVTDAAAMLVSETAGSVPGSVLFPAIHGRRSLVVEVQALVSPGVPPNPRRSVKGIESARIHQILAVLHRHAGLDLASHDVYVSIVGGLRLKDPGADLPVAFAIASSLLGKPVGSVAAWGEVGLTGEIRPVAHANRRRSEAERLGVAKVVGPEGGTHIADLLRRAGLAGQ